MANEKRKIEERLIHRAESVINAVRHAKDLKILHARIRRLDAALTAFRAHKEKSPGHVTATEAVAQSGMAGVEGH